MTSLLDEVSISELKSSFEDLKNDSEMLCILHKRLKQSIAKMQRHLGYATETLRELKILKLDVKDRIKQLTSKSAITASKAA